MTRFLLCVWLMLGLVQACQQDDEVPCPERIQEKIKELARAPKQSPVAEVWQYDYRGQQVYLISGACCDQYHFLYDACLNIVCAPSGGVQGRGDGKCPDFQANATNPVLVWRDPR